MNNQLQLSVIIPAYRESERIGKNLVEIDEYLNARKISYEVVVITDGSPDDTAEVARSFAGKINNLRVIENKENHGKGFVVRQGLLETKGALRLFLDADGSTSISHLDSFLPEFENGFDVVIGSREAKGTEIKTHQPRYREILGDGGNWLIRIVLGLWSYPDTQCGFKMMTAEAAEAVASRMIVDRFGFDFELIVLAKKLGFKIKQMPVFWNNEEGSTVKLTGPNGYIQVLIDLFKTKLRIMTGQYKLKKK